MDQGQRDAVHALQLDYVWSVKTGFRHGNAGPGTTTTLQERGDEVRGLKRVEVRVMYQDTLARTTEGRDELVRLLGAAMGRWKSEMERE